MALLRSPFNTGLSGLFGTSCWRKNVCQRYKKQILGLAGPGNAESSFSMKLLVSALVPPPRLSKEGRG